LCGAGKTIICIKYSVIINEIYSKCYIIYYYYNKIYGQGNGSWTWYDGKNSDY